MNIDISNVTAIVVAYQSSHVIERCLDNLTSIKKIVIDNSSDLVLKKKLLNKYKDIKVIHPKSNLGFGSANNLGILIAETDYVLCLNPDVIFEEKYLLNLVEIYSTYENVGLVSPQVFDHNDIYLDNHCYSYLNKISSFKINKNIHNKIKSTRPEGNISTQFITGAIFLCKRQILIKIGLFDEKIFLYFEDQDICKRLFRNKFQIIECSTAKAIHPNNDKNRSVILSTKISFLQSMHHKYSEYYFKSKYQNKLYVFLLSIFQSIEFLLRSIFYFFIFRKNKSLTNIARVLGVFKFIFRF